jgi:hypothetical protein
VAGLISGAVAFAVSQRYYEIRWEYGKIAAIFLIFFGSAMIVIFLRYLGISYEMRAVFKFISLACYVYLGMKLNIITRQNFYLLKDIILPVKAVS